jgi:hypothetical protein
MGPYRAGVDTSVLYGGQPSLSIDGVGSPPTQIGPGTDAAKFSVASGVRQAIRADRYRGRRIRLSEYLRTEGVGGVWSHDRS